MKSNGCKTGVLPMSRLLPAGVAKGKFFDDGSATDDGYQ
jgi:hypothetical protein